METTNNYSIGLRYGLITGVFYTALLITRLRVFSSTPVSFSTFTAISYIAILIMFYVAGRQRRAWQGGTARLRDIFQTILIVIVLAELFYVVTSIVYLKYVDPGFFDRFADNARHFLVQNGASDAQIEAALKNFQDLKVEMSPGTLLKSIGLYVVMDCVPGLAIAAILQRKKDNFGPASSNE